MEGGNENDGAWNPRNSFTEPAPSPAPLAIPPFFPSPGTHPSRQVRGTTLNVNFRGAVVLLGVRPCRLVDEGGVGGQHHGALFRLLPIVERVEAPGLRRRGGRGGGRAGGREGGMSRDPPLVLFNKGIQNEAWLSPSLPPSLPPSTTYLLQGLHILCGFLGLQVSVRVGITIQPAHASREGGREGGRERGGKNEVRKDKAREKRGEVRGRCGRPTVFNDVDHALDVALVLVFEELNVLLEVPGLPVWVKREKGRAGGR